jgi:hypothetical protein
MAAVVYTHPLPSSSDPNAVHAAMAQASNTLRRAVYVHVSDLTSAYNIDNAKLEEELTRVLEETSRIVAAQKSDDPSLAHAATSVLGVPTELDTSASSQRRLHPPRVGYNLCLYVRASFAVLLSCAIL